MGRSENKRFFFHSAPMSSGPVAFKQITVSDAAPAPSIWDYWWAGHLGLSVHPRTLRWARHEAGVKTSGWFSLRIHAGSVEFKRITVSEVAPAPSIYNLTSFPKRVAGLQRYDEQR